MIVNGIEVLASPFIPRRYPTRWQIWRWMYWSPEEEKPAPYDQIFLIDGKAFMRPAVFETLRVQLSAEAARRTAAVVNIGEGKR